MIKTYAQAIQEATSQLLAEDPNTILIGEGVPSGIFGTTKDLKSLYPAQVFDAPLAENGITGVCVGAGMSGMRVVQVHQRMDFLLLAADQLINNSAKISHMFPGQHCNLTVRCVVGRGWGQGSQHSQSFQSLFAAVPGLKVVMPTSPTDSKGLLVSAVRCPDPVIFIEHRWLHNIAEEVPDCMYETPLDKSKVLRQGEDITVVSMSYSTIEALKAQEMLKVFNVSPEVIDLINCSPIDIETIGASVRKTGRLLVCETGHTKNSVGSEIVRQVTERHFHQLKSPPIVLGLPDYPCPTSHFLTENYYPDEYDIANTVLKLVGSQGRIENKPKKDHDIFPGFQGPF